jgi:hypothetical protein
MALYTPVALKLHAFGLRRLHDPNWTGMVLFDHLKRPIRHEAFLQKFEKDGFLVWLGNLLFDEYMADDSYLDRLRGEYRLWHLEDYCAFLRFHGADKGLKSLTRLEELVAKIGDLYEKDEHKYYRRLRSERVLDRILDLYSTVKNENEAMIERVRKEYAANYADRVFHDRELCGYLAQLLVHIGFDRMDSPKDTEPKQWVDRVNVPAWAKKAVIARDNGICGQCGANITMRLEADDHFDHMVPISRGGCNDLVNLQMLCEKCNLKKSDTEVPIHSSIPPYMLRFHWKK